jgi:hypothetical protein
MTDYRDWREGMNHGIKPYINSFVAFKTVITHWNILRAASTAVSMFLLIGQFAGSHDDQTSLIGTFINRALFAINKHKYEQQADQPAT